MTISEELIRVRVIQWLSRWRAGDRQPFGAAVTAVRTDLHIDQLLPELAGAQVAEFLRASILAFQTAAAYATSAAPEPSVLLSISLRQSDRLVPAPTELRLLQEIDLFRPPEIVVGYLATTADQEVNWWLEEYRCPVSGQAVCGLRRPPALYHCYRSEADVSAGVGAFERCVIFGGSPPSGWAVPDETPPPFGLIILPD